MRKFILSLALLFAWPNAAFAACVDDQLWLPGSIEDIYVIFQKPGQERVDGSSERIAIVSPDEFCAGFEGWRKEAKAGGWNFIVTAVNDRGQWIQTEIKFKGKRLRHRLYRDPEGSMSYPGALVPLD